MKRGQIGKEGNNRCLVLFRAGNTDSAIADLGDNGAHRRIGLELQASAKQIDRGQEGTPRCVGVARGFYPSNGKVRRLARKLHEKARLTAAGLGPQTNRTAPTCDRVFRKLPKQYKLGRTSHETGRTTPQLVPCFRHSGETQSGRRGAGHRRGHESEVPVEVPPASVGNQDVPRNRTVDEAAETLQEVCAGKRVELPLTVDAEEASGRHVDRG